MKSLKDTQNIVSEFSVNPRSEMRQKVLDEALDNFKELKQKGGSINPLGVWSLLVSNRIIQFSCGILIVLTFVFLGSQDNQRNAELKNDHHQDRVNLFGELDQIRRMSAAYDISGLLKMVLNGQLESKFVAAEALNNIIDAHARVKLTMHVSGDIIIDSLNDNLRLSSTDSDHWLEVENGRFIVHKNNTTLSEKSVRLMHDPSADPDHWSQLEREWQGLYKEIASLEENLNALNNKKTVVNDELRERLVKLNTFVDSIEESIYLTFEGNGRLKLESPIRGRKAYVEKRQGMVHVEASGHIVESESVTLLLELNPVLTDGPPVPYEGWKKRFDSVYSLNPGEVLRWVRSPFIPERQIYATSEMHYYSGSDNPPPPGYLFFRWNDKLRNWMVTMHPCSLGLVIDCIGLKTFQINGPDELRRLQLGGDFIARDNVSIENKLSALETILHKELGRDIRFVKKYVKHQAIIVSGQFQHTPLDGVQDPNSIYIYPDSWQDYRGPEPSELPKRGSLVKMIEEVGRMFESPIVYETENLEDNSVNYMFSVSFDLAVANAKSKREKQAILDSVLKNLSKQTGLQFNYGQHKVEVWFISER